MIKHAFIILVLVTVLAACSPAVTATINSGSVAVVTVKAITQPFTLGLVNIITVNPNDIISSSDPRCKQTAPDLLQCEVGALQPGEVTQFPVNTNGVAIDCIATGYVGGGLTDYRLIRCVIN